MLKMMFMHCICPQIAVLKEDIAIDMTYVPARIISAERKNAVPAEKYAAMKHAKIIKKSYAVSFSDLHTYAMDVLVSLTVH